MLTVCFVSVANMAFVAVAVRCAIAGAKHPIATGSESKMRLADSTKIRTETCISKRTCEPMMRLLLTVKLLR